MLLSCLSDPICVVHGIAAGEEPEMPSPWGADQRIKYSGLIKIELKAIVFRPKYYRSTSFSFIDLFQKLKFSLFIVLFELPSWECQTAFSVPVKVTLPKKKCWCMYMIM